MTLEARGIGKTLGGRVILDRVDLACPAGEVAVVLGANGSGKTTLLRVLAGLLEPSRGSISIAGHSLAYQPVRAKAHLGYVPDALEAPPDLLVSELIALVAALKSAALGRPAALDPRQGERFGAGAIWGQRLRSLSFGQRKRAALCAALVGAPELLLLDEPSNGLDPGGVDAVVELIEERRAAGTSTLLSTNDPELERRLPATRYRLQAAALVRLSHRQHAGSV